MTAGEPTAVEVETVLEELLVWDALARSPQLARFLQYVVEKTLAGDAASIKAYSIAVDVFGRPQDFDPQNDPIVRVQARRLRTLLDQYYAEEGAEARVRISLPVGRYVPTFEWRDPSAETLVTPSPAVPAEDAGQADPPGANPLPQHAGWADVVFWSRLFVGFAILIAAAVAFIIWTSGHAK